jgi:hypothetical protein
MLNKALDKLTDAQLLIKKHERAGEDQILSAVETFLS